MKKLVQLLLLSISFLSIAQKGDFLLTHHYPANSNLDNSNFEIISDNNGLICLANRAGVLKYDGDSWDFFGTPSAALSLAVDDDNTTYVGSIGTFGKITFEENETLFQPLIEQDSLDELFFQTLEHGGSVYFLGNETLGIYNVAEDQTILKTGDFINIFQIGDRLYVNTTETTFRIEGDSLIEDVLKVQIASAHNFRNRPPLLIDFNGEMHVWQNRIIRIGHNKLIEENGFEIQEAKWINDSLIVCSTYSNGVLFLNYNDLEYFEVTDYHSGLPDNEIYAIHTDQGGSVWIAHPFGMTSVSPLFPAFSYSNFPGLKGNLTGVFQKKNGLWVTSSLGLFYFDRDTTFKNHVYYTRVNQRRQTRPAPKPAPQTTTSKKKKRGLKGLFSKKKRAESSSEEKQEKKGFFKSIARGVEDLFDNPDNVERLSAKQAKSAKYQRRIRKVPVKVNYKFSQVEGTDGKYFDMIDYQDHLLLVGNSAIYEIKDGGSEVVISENVRTVTTISDGHLLVSTTDLQLKSFKLVEDIWVEHASQSIDDIIVNMRQDRSGKIWLAGSSSLYNIELTDSTIAFSNVYALDNQSLDHVDILERMDTVYFINSHGYFYYDEVTDEILENVSLREQIGLAHKTIAEPSKKAVWVNNGKNWYLIPSRGKIQSFDYLSLFTDLVSISKDLNSNEYWLLTRDNQLLKYDESKSRALASYDLFVKKLSNQRGTIDMRKKFVLAYDENFLTVELSKPDYLGLLNPEFQYRLNGLHTEWSEWTTSKSIDFSYLPPGQYSLSVRSRDAFGRMEEATMLDFTVRSPYWQQPWFYALQIFFFGSLVIISSRMNQKKTQNRLLSGGLSVLTLILIIEFIQSAAGALLDIQSTPVVDFLIDVFVALLIFPLEKFLREFLSKGTAEVKVPKKVIPKKKAPVKKKLAAKRR